MYDLYKRNIDYLRISVTDRCNLRCTYCMPPEGIESKQHSDILTYEKIVEIARCAVDKGIKKIRLTGGEPLVRKGIINLVKMLSEIEGLQDLSMTTNGILLKKHAQDLADAGLNRVNVSLDTLDTEEYRSITRGGDLQMVLEGIEMARKVGLNPIKIIEVYK
jgi:cyclic pyranopterin phosphate synthase